MDHDQIFTFICDTDMAGKINRVITVNSGEIIGTDKTQNGTIITIRKK